MIQRKTRKQRCGYGFTLLEVIVVVAIIAFLAAIAVPMLSVAFKQAKKTRAAADLQSIAVGLDAYKADFGDYPRPDVPNVGFAVLAKALISPGPVGGPLAALGTAPFGAGTVASIGTPGPPPSTYQEYVAFGQPAPAGGFAASTAPPDPTNWAIFSYSDGKAGPGFKARQGGKAYGPYLPEGKFKLRGLAILDGNDNPILYFVARPQKPAQTATGWKLVDDSATSTGGGPPYYEAGQNISFFLRVGESISNPVDRITARKRMEAFLVQNQDVMSPTTFNNAMIETASPANESPATTGPYLLWSAGADGSFGVTATGTPTGTITKKDIEKCDDITNFQR